jgi:hypothetical protein
MSKKDPYEITEETLASLRVEEDAVRVISEKLGVKQMGPADHIRTKHEVKAFVESGDKDAARELLRTASMRRHLQQGEAVKIGEQRRNSLKP